MALDAITNIPSGSKFRVRGGLSSDGATSVTGLASIQDQAGTQTFLAFSRLVNSAIPWDLWETPILIAPQDLKLVLNMSAVAGAVHLAWYGIEIWELRQA